VRNPSVLPTLNSARRFSLKLRIQLTPPSLTTEEVMRRIGICCCAAILLGCGKKSDRPAVADSTATAGDTGMAAAAPAPVPAAPAPLSMADVQGKWKMRTMAEGSDSTLVEYELDIGPSGSALHFPKRPPVKMKSAVDGDSLVGDAGPYESVLRKGLKVTTHTVLRLENGKLVGTTVAHYATKGADSVRNLRSEGTKE